MKLTNILKHNKNRKYFEQQISLIYKDLYKFIYSIIKNQHLTEDILQETLMKAYEKFHTINDLHKFKSWIFTIARNESLFCIKKYKREIQSEDIYLEFRQEFSQDVPDELVINREIKEHVRESIKVLKPIDQEIMYLRYYYDLTLSEIALILNMNENTVKTHHSRSKEKIYKHIAYNKPFFEVAATTLEKKEVK